MSGNGRGQPGWYIDGGYYGNPSAHMPSNISRSAPGYVPFQSVLDTSGRYAYHPGAQQYPQLAHHPGHGMHWSCRRPLNAGINQGYDFQMRSQPYYGSFGPGPWR